MPCGERARWREESKTEKGGAQYNFESIAFKFYSCHILQQSVRLIRVLTEQEVIESAFLVGFRFIRTFVCDEIENVTLILSSPTDSVWWNLARAARYSINEWWMTLDKSTQKQAKLQNRSWHIAFVDASIETSHAKLKTNRDSKIRDVVWITGELVNCWSAFAVLGDVWNLNRSRWRRRRPYDVKNTIPYTTWDGSHRIALAVLLSEGCRSDWIMRAYLLKRQIY